MSFCSPLQNSQPHTPERNDMHGKVQPNEIYIERIYDAPVKAVWEAWTVTDKVEKWWGPRGFSLTTHSKDLRSGGHWHYTMHGPDGTDYPNRTFYHEVQPFQKLIYDHGANDTQPPLFRVTALFEEFAGKTKLKMIMSLASAEAAVSIRKFIKEAGGNATWDRLAEYVNETECGVQSFVINRSFPTSIETLFQAWTTPAQLCQWLPPAGFEMECLQADIRGGGKLLSRMSNDNGVSFCVQFDYLECSPSRLVYRQRFCDEFGQPAQHPGLPEFPQWLLHTISFVTEEDGMTRVTVVTSPDGAPTAAEISIFLDTRTSMTTGWSGSFDALEELLS